MLAPWKKSYDLHRQHIKKLRHYFADKSLSSQSYGFSSSHVWIWKRSVFIPIPKKGNAKECSNYSTIALISHASKIMLKILQARLQKFVTRELPNVQAWFRKGRGTRDQIAKIRWITEKAEALNFGHFIRRVESLEKTLMLGKIEGKRMRWLDGITDSMGMNLGKLWETVYATAESWT